MPTEHVIHFDHMQLSSLRVDAYLRPNDVLTNETKLEFTINEVDYLVMGGVCCNGSAIPEYQTLDISIISVVLEPEVRRANFVY